MSINPEQRTGSAHSGNLPTEQGGERPVEEFDMSLQDAVDQGKVTDWPPVTETPPAHDTLVPARNTRRRNLLIGAGGAAAAAVIAAVATLGGGGSSNEAPNPDRSSTSAGVEPGAEASTTETPSTDPTETVAEVDISNLSTQPTEAQIQKALEGVSGDVEPLEAARQLGYILAVHQNSGTVDPETREETEESKAQGQELLRAFYGPFIDSAVTRGESTNRGYIADMFDASAALGPGYEYTMKTEIVPHEDTLTQVSDDSYHIDIDLLFEDNNDNPNNDAIDTDELNAGMTITRVDGRWYVSTF